jgi:inward rectifier potassium channel
VFADQAVITGHNGRPTLMVKIGNGRTSLLTRTAVAINALINEESPEGGRYRRIHELRLIRGVYPIFPLMTTFMHPIDENSPLARFDLARIGETDVRVLVGIEAHDPALGTNVQDLKTYFATDIRFGWRFADTVTVHESGAVEADLTRISQLEPEGAPQHIPVGTKSVVG